MKSFIAVVFLFIGSASFGQTTECSSLWLGGSYDSIEVVKKTAEQYLQTTLQLSSDAEVKTMYDFKDKEELNLMKVWMKQKRVAAGGSISTIHIISSFRITGVAENIQGLFNALKEKVSKCSTASTDASFVFGAGKVFVEKTGGDWSKKNLQMATLTVTTVK